MAILSDKKRQVDGVLTPDTNDIVEAGLELDTREPPAPTTRPPTWQPGFCEKHNLRHDPKGGCIICTRENTRVERKRQRRHAIRSLTLPMLGLLIAGIGIYRYFRAPQVPQSVTVVIPDPTFQGAPPLRPSEWRGNMLFGDKTMPFVMRFESFQAGRLAGQTTWTGTDKVMGFEGTIKGDRLHFVDTEVREGAPTDFGVVDLKGVQELLGDHYNLKLTGRKLQGTARGGKGAVTADFVGWLEVRIPDPEAEFWADF